MKKLIVYYGDVPLCVEGFPQDCKRSCSGAIHLLNRRMITVTDEEFEFIRSTHPVEAKSLRVISEQKDQPDEPATQESNGQPVEDEKPSESAKANEEAKPKDPPAAAATGSEESKEEAEPSAEKPIRRGRRKKEET